MRSGRSVSHAHRTLAEHGLMCSVGPNSLCLSLELEEDEQGDHRVVVEEAAAEGHPQN